MYLAGVTCGWGVTLPNLDFEVFLLKFIYLSPSLFVGMGIYFFEITVLVHL